MPEGTQLVEYQKLFFNASSAEETIICRPGNNYNQGALAL